MLITTYNFHRNVFYELTRQEKYRHFQTDKKIDCFELLLKVHDKCDLKDLKDPVKVQNTINMKYVPIVSELRKLYPQDTEFGKAWLA